MLFDLFLGVGFLVEVLFFDKMGSDVTLRIGVCFFGDVYGCDIV